MNRIIVLQQPKDNLGSQVLELLNVLSIIKKYRTETKIIFDFKNISFVHPLFILSLSVIYSLVKDKKIITVKDTVNGSKEKNISLDSYLGSICFPAGLNPDKYPSWEEAINSYVGKRYIPIINFPSSKKEEKTKIRENFLSKINSILEKNLKLNSQYKSGISYLISEMTDNIVDHSGVESGWLFAQYYPNKEYLDVCIIDNGKTILGSYKDAGISDIKTDRKAIRNAMLGKSTKGKERGSGIPTSKNMIVQGLRGEFVLISGKGILINNHIITLPVKWHGTILALRIPRNVQDFQYIKYV